MESLLNKKNANYKIIKECHISSCNAYVIGYNVLKAEFVVWLASSSNGKNLHAFYSGYYTDNLNKANIDFYHRISKMSEDYKNYYTERRTYEIQNED